MEIMKKFKKTHNNQLEKKKLNLNLNSINNTMFPHKSNINNLKSKKYFSTISSTSDIMKKALHNYRAKSISSNYQNQNDILQITSSSISTSNMTKYIKNLKIKKEKELKLKTSFNKLKPKLLHIASKKILNINDELDEFKISQKDNNKIHKKILSEINPLIINYDKDIIYDDDSLDISDDDLYNNNICLTERNNNNFNNNISCININIKDINFNEGLKLETLFDELIKELENNDNKKIFNNI